MSIPIQQARKLFTTATMQKYKEVVPSSSFLKSFFDVKTYVTKSLSIEVQRGSEYIAVDVERSSEGNRNTMGKFTEKQYIPPFYKEVFDATSLDRYDIAFGQPENIAPTTVGYLASDVAEKISMLREKIERAKELQCAQVFETGIVTMYNGDNIDYKRKATSLVDLGGAGGYWSVAGTDIDAQISAGGDFIRTYGKNSVKEMNLVMSGSEFAALKLTDWWTDTVNWRRASLMDIKMPQADANGGVYHGEVSAGSYRVHLWTYDEIYNAASGGAITRYMPENKAFLTPVKGTRFDLAHAGVPAIMTDKKNAEFPRYIAQVSGEYYLNNYIDEKRTAHDFELYSAPLAIPVSVDMIYTMQALA